MLTRSEKDAIDYQNLLHANKCVRCKSVLPEGYMFVMCENCREIVNTRHRNVYKLQRKLGLCHDCGEPVYDGKSRCEDCRKRRNFYAREQYKRKKQEFAETP